MRRLAKINDFKIAQQFLPTMGVWGRSPQEKGEAEKPQALKRGGRLSPSYLI
jgi:hypothetical protein